MRQSTKSLYQAKNALGSFSFDLESLPITEKITEEHERWIAMSLVKNEKQKLDEERKEHVWDAGQWKKKIGEN